VTSKLFEGMLEENFGTNLGVISKLFPHHQLQESMEKYAGSIEFKIGDFHPRKVLSSISYMWTSS